MRHPPTIAELERAASYLAAAPDLGVAKVGEAFLAWLSGEVEELPAALGFTPGRRAVGTLQALDRRDQLLVKAAETHLAHLGSANARADALASALKHYRASGWPRHRTAAVCPPAIAGTLGGACWAVLRTRDAELSASRIRRILAGLATSSQEVANDSA